MITTTAVRDTGRTAPQADATTTSNVASMDEEQSRFWYFYLLLSVGIYIGASIGIAFYLLFSPALSNRLALLSLTAITSMAQATTIPWIRRLSRTQWRTTFILALSLISGSLITIACMLDTGVESPLMTLLVLPVLSAAIAMSRRAVLLTIAASIMELGVVTATDMDLRSSLADLTILATTIFVVDELAYGWTMIRTRLQSSETRLFHQVVQLAHTDSLTGCLNHGALFERLEEEINRALRTGTKLCLMVIDVDFFKGYNDTHGHQAGDVALATIGRVMRGASRNFDLVGRVGGDEFAVVLPATPLEGAQLVAERMDKMLERPDGLNVTASIGFAELDPNEPTAKRLFRDADSALYSAKAGGRDQTAYTVRAVEPQDNAAEIQLKGVKAHALVEARTALADAKRAVESQRSSVTEAAEAFAILDGLEQSDSVGLGFVDQDNRVIRINAMLAAVYGGTVAQQLGATMADVAPQLWRMLEPLFGQVRRSGQPLLNHTIIGGLPSQPAHSWTLSLFPASAHGDMTGICVVAIDTTAITALDASERTQRDAVVAALAAAVEMRDPYTDGHQSRTATIATSIAQEMQLDAEVVSAIDLAARIHDVGKLAVPSEILARPGKLLPAEMDLVRIHPQAASDMLQRIGLANDVRVMVYQHHERINGSGYPNGLVGEQISIGARIIAVADVYEAMSSHRPYRAALGTDIALQEIVNGAGILYDRDVVAAFVRVVQKGSASLHAA